jgi:hypothetical protein
VSALDSNPTGAAYNTSTASPSVTASFEYAGKPVEKTSNGISVRTGAPIAVSIYACSAVFDQNELTVSVASVAQGERNEATYELCEGNFVSQGSVTVGFFSNPCR